MPKETIVKSDFLGIYVVSGSYIIRPNPKKPSRFKEGDKVATYHFGGSPMHGIGKDSSCGRGQYLERWVGTGEVRRVKNDKNEAQKSYDFYMNTFGDRCTGADSDQSSRAKDKDFRGQDGLTNFERNLIQITRETHGEEYAKFMEQRILHPEKSISFSQGNIIVF
jgi:hypothetical protein